MTGVQCNDQARQGSSREGARANRSEPEQITRIRRRLSGSDQQKQSGGVVVVGEGVSRRKVRISKRVPGNVSYGNPSPKIPN